MQQNGSDSSSSSPATMFAGVRFVLFGFDSVSKAQYCSELVSRGGTDVGRYGSSCTHVIVCGRVYDDPVCVAARQDGKILVTELWIDDSLDFGMLADASRVLYKPVKDLNGIPGSESLCICLTGFERQERSDVMNMVSMMGARFVKPLIANQVTHLICYKFEGEKYELAKRVNIKLVNHRWLEESLKAWEILPIDNYTESSWGLEILEAEAKDSEEETENPEKPSTLLDTVAAKESHITEHCLKNHGLFSTPCKEASSVKALDVSGQNNKVLQECDHHVAGGIAHACDNCAMADAITGGNLSTPCYANLNIKGNELSTSSTTVKWGSRLPNAVDEKLSSPSHSMEISRVLISAEEPSNILPKSPQRNLDVSQSTLRETTVNVSADIESPTAGAGIYHLEATSSGLPHKRKNNVPGVGLKLSKSELQDSKAFTPPCPSSGARSTHLGTTNDLPHGSNGHGLTDMNKCSDGATISKPKASEQTTPSKKPLSYKRKSLKRGQPALGTKISNNAVSPSEERKADLLVDACPRQALAKTNNASPTGCKVIRDLPLDNKPEIDGDASIKDTARVLGTLAIDARSVHKTSPEAPRPPLGGSEKSEQGAKCDIAVSDFSNAAATGGDVAMSDIADAATEEPGKTCTLEQEVVKSPDGQDSEVRNLSSTASAETCKENESEAEPPVRTKKVVAKRSLGTMKLSNGKPRKGKNDTYLDRTVAPKLPSVKSGKVGKMKVEQKLDREVSYVKNEEKVPFSKDVNQEDKVDVIMDDKVMVAQHSTSENNNKNTAMDLMDTSIDSEKENKPKEIEGLTVEVFSHLNCMLASKPGKKPIQGFNGIAGDNKNEMQTSSCTVGARSEPAWFILSGHPLQRKEFQMVIRRLKGRLCRDSHNWSYQATHFIVPDPIRRTEKFFAAAASGRWILKTDYLTASNEVGNFLDEEPFEWHRKGLTEDGAISLEAPRKWRLLREQTGHGALHGMRIIIYGECITPTLDTLKRVVRAGDGTILATSPPYTRFLKSGVDYAIISPGTPHVDLWVQEFVRNEIPCVLADYLVEYVCKPGYSLERHVLYNTHAWAEISFANLLSHSEEVII